jgi:hypothetical protein
VLSPVITGTNWYSGMFTPKLGGLVEISGNVVGGHEYEVVGIDVEHKLVKCANSWGTTWGDKGFFYMTWDTWGRLLSEQGDVTVPTK